MRFSDRSWNCPERKASLCDLPFIQFFFRMREVSCMGSDLMHGIPPNFHTLKFSWLFCWPSLGYMASGDGWRVQGSIAGPLLTFAGNLAALRLQLSRTTLSKTEHHSAFGVVACVYGDNLTTVKIESLLGRSCLCLSFQCSVDTCYWLPRSLQCKQGTLLQVQSASFLVYY